MQEQIRRKLEQRLRGFEYRQRARSEQRAARQKAYRITSMMREQGARKYLDFKGIPYRRDTDSATGITTLIIPGQISLQYDSQGRFLASGPPGAFSAGS